MTISNILGCAGSVVFSLIAYKWIPFFGPFLSLLIPLPFLFYLSKLGLNEGIKVCIAAFLIIGITAKLMGEPTLVFLCIEMGVMGFILSVLFRKEYSYSLTIFLGTLAMLLVGLAFTLFVIVIKGVTPVEIAVRIIQANLDAVVGVYEKKGINPEVIDQIKNLGPVVIELIKKIYPSLVVVGTGFIVWLNVVISKPLFRIRGLKYPDLGHADMWRVPEYLVWGLIIAGFAKLLSISSLDFVATNALIIFSVIYAFHGLSIVLFFFNKYNVPALTRFIIYLIFALQQLSMILLALLGIFDQWIDFRKLNRGNTRAAE